MAKSNQKPDLRRIASSNTDEYPIYGNGKGLSTVKFDKVNMEEMERLMAGREDF